MKTTSAQVAFSMFKCLLDQDNQKCHFVAMYHKWQLP